MKKILKIGIPLLIIGLMLSNTMVRADFNVTAGDDNDYEVTSSSWTLAIGGNTGTGTGLNFEDTNYAEGTNFNVEVIAETSSSVDYNVTIGAQEEDYSSSGLGNVFFIAFTILLPMLVPMMVGGTWDQAEVEKGPGLWGEFFLDNVVGEAFYEFSNNQTALDELTEEESDITFKKFTGVFENSTNIAVFDWACDFDWVNASTNTDYGGTFRYKIAYDQTTGWVKGWRLALDYAGTLEGTLMEITWNQLIQQVGYTLGTFAIGTGLFPGFEWFLIFPTLGLLAIPIIIKKRK